MFNEKRGLSPVVATIAIILLTFAAVVVISSFVVPFVRDNLTKSSECIEYREYFTFKEDFGYNCYVVNSGGRLYGLSVGTKSTSSETEGRVSGFKLSFKTGGSSNSVDVKEGAQTSRSSGSVSMLNSTINLLEIPGSGEIKTYVYNNSAVFDSVSIHPVLNSKRVCDEADSIKINQVCDNSVAFDIS